MDKKPLEKFPPDEGTQGEKTGQEPGLLSRWMETLAHLGLGELSLRLGTNALAVLLVVAVIWLMRTVYHQVGYGVSGEVSAASEPTPTPVLTTAALPQPAAFSLDGISRQAIPHTTIPSRPRLDVTQYNVQNGDTIFGIAAKFNLDPKTLLWGNYDTLKDDVELLRPGQVLNILPVDGTYYRWLGTESLTGVAKYFDVDVETIINYPGNHLDADTIGDLSHPNIKIGTWLIVPGGHREFTTWNAPLGISRTNPAVARVIGPGACGPISGGAVGFGTFVWPTVEHWLSGTDYRPDLKHFGVDFAGALDNAIYAVDAGVVVYAGWNDWGYGNLVIIDHGNGWQSLYAHQDRVLVQCGESVGQGQTIGLIGATGHATGPHLHFELSYKSAYVNPHSVFNIASAQ
jgi:LysM repeat protein